MKWLLLLLLVLPAWATVEEDYRQLVAVARVASDMLRDVATDAAQVTRHAPAPETEVYRRVVRGLSARTQAVKISAAEGPLRVAVTQAETGVAELQLCLDQLQALREDPDNDLERERMRSTLSRTQKTLEKLLATLSDRSANPPAPTPPQSPVY